MKKIVLISLIIILFAMSFKGLAQTNDAETNTEYLKKFYEEEQRTEKRREEVSPTWLFIRSMLILVVVLGGAYIGIRFLYRKAGIRTSLDFPFVDTIVTKPLGLGKYLQILQVGNNYYAIVIGDKELLLLGKIEDQETIDMIRLEVSRIGASEKPTRFSDLLSSILGLEKKEDEEKEKLNKFFKETIEKLRRLKK